MEGWDVEGVGPEHEVCSWCRLPVCQSRACAPSIKGMAYVQFWPNRLSFVSFTDTWKPDNIYNLIQETVHLALGLQTLVLLDFNIKRIISPHVVPYLFIHSRLGLPMPQTHIGNDSSPHIETRLTGLHAQAT